MWVIALYLNPTNQPGYPISFHCISKKFGLEAIPQIIIRHADSQLLSMQFHPSARRVRMELETSAAARAVLLAALLCMCVCGCGGIGIGVGRKLRGLVEETVVLQYHDGPLLTSSEALDVHIIWYGKFSAVQRSIVGDFVESLGADADVKQPSVKEWWSTTDKYRSPSPDMRKKKENGGMLRVRLGRQVVDESYSVGKSLKRSDVGSLVEGALKSKALPLPRNASASAAVAVYLLLTSAEVTVEGFCRSSCGFHDDAEMEGMKVVYAWAGNAERACPGQCAWPFHQPMYGPQTAALVAPNGDVGIDGMIINVATVVAGAVTNPFNSGYFQGDAAAPMEAVSACGGVFGKGAYPGYPGHLLLDASTGASYNAHGIHSRTFLLPAMWDPPTSSCKTLP